VEQPVDAVLVDVHLDGPVDGLEVSRMLTARDRGLKVVLISSLVDEQRLAEAPRLSAVGFLPKGPGRRGHGRSCGCEIVPRRRSWRRSCSRGLASAERLSGTVPDLGPPLTKDGQF
jgi:hypothetical protein